MRTEPDTTTASEAPRRRRLDIAWIALWTALIGLHVALVVLFLWAPKSLAFAIVAILALIVWVVLGVA